MVTNKTLFYLWLILSFGVLFSLNAVSQESSNTKITKSRIDTLKLWSDDPVKSPWGAVLRSAIIPGWGQIYNEAYFKGPLVFALNGGLAWKVFYHNKKWRDVRRSARAQGISADKSHRDTRNTFIWYWGLTYLLTMVDSYVDANLFGFTEIMKIAWMPPNKFSRSPMITLTIKR